MRLIKYSFLFSFKANKEIIFIPTRVIGKDRSSTIENGFPSARGGKSRQWTGNTSSSIWIETIANRIPCRIAGTCVASVHWNRFIFKSNLISRGFVWKPVDEDVSDTCVGIWRDSSTLRLLKKLLEWVAMNMWVVLNGSERFSFCSPVFSFIFPISRYLCRNNSVIIWIWTINLLI